MRIIARKNPENIYFVLSRNNLWKRICSWKQV